MNLPRIEIHGHLHHRQSALFHVSRYSLSPPYFLSPKPKLYRSVNPFPASTLSSLASFSPSKPNFRFSHVRVSNIEEAPSRSNEEKANNSDDEDLTADGEVYKKTLRLVERSMFAALGGLAYILRSSLAIEDFFKKETVKQGLLETGDFKLMEQCKQSYVCTHSNREEASSLQLKEF